MVFKFFLNFEMQRRNSCCGNDVGSDSSPISILKMEKMIRINQFSGKLTSIFPVELRYISKFLIEVSMLFSDGWMDCIG